MNKRRMAQRLLVLARELEGGTRRAFRDDEVYLGDAASSIDRAVAALYEFQEGTVDRSQIRSTQKWIASLEKVRSDIVGMARR